MSICRKSYPSGVSDGKWSLIASYLLLQREDADAALRAVRRPTVTLPHVVNGRPP